MNRTACASIVLGFVFGLAAPVQAQNPEWRVLRPSNSGIPGEEMQCIRLAPDHALWVGARWPFWGEGGVGVLDQPTEVWTTYSNVDTPVPGEYIRDIEFAANGAVWMASEGGLVRKQGESWTVYNTSNSPLLHNDVRSIALDSRGHVWLNNSNVQNQNAALFEFDPVNNTWRKFAVPTELPWPDPWRSLSSVFVDSRDRVWVGNATLTGAAMYDGQSWRLLGSNLTSFKRFAEDLNGNIWLLSGGLGYSFYKYDGQNFTEYSAANTPFVNTTITCFGVDDDGWFYVGNWAGQVIRTSNSGGNWQSFLSGLNIIFNLEPDPASTGLWVQTIGAVGHFRNDGSWVRDYNSYNTGMPDFWVDRFNLDPQGNLWLATGEAGLSRFDGQHWRNWGAHNAGSEPYPFAGNEPMGAFHMDRNGVGWMGGNGIARWIPETGQFTGFWNWQNNPGMGVSQWQFFAQDMNGTLFSAEEYGAIYRFSGSMWVREPVQAYAVLGLPGMQADSRGNVWIAAWFDIHKWNGSVWAQITLPYRDYFFDLGGINDMAIGPDDVLWFATPQGIVRFDGVNFTLYRSETLPLPARSVSSIDIRSDGVMGIAAADDANASGIAIVRGDISDPANWEVHRYGQSPQPHWQITQSTFDADGTYWVSALSMGMFGLIVDPVSAPQLSLTGSCPGPMQIGVTGATPGGNVALLHATGTGSVRIPNGNPCAGTTLGLNSTAQLYRVIRADAGGGFLINLNVPPGACGRFVQGLDASTCTTTNVEPL
ncbi:MAG: hypothetical protein IT430_17410 [Phycisphaerales bacterium]|nr:hypothetical protein [Phycisphaerales bacterium]